jgi:outer membrane receptor for ferrienterochelin and colicin
MKQLLLIFLAAGLIIQAQGQSLSGKVFGLTDKGKEIIPGALVQWLGDTTGTQTNENGVFKLERAASVTTIIVVSAPLFSNDTIDVKNKTYLSVLLKPDGHNLTGVTVRDERMAYLAQKSVGQTEIITKRELSKAACCDLAGCFGTQASVQAQSTNIVTNAQELRLLGLSGVYNQVLIDGLPIIQGVMYTYGISTYSGTLVDQINVSKGTTSVLQGFESISGQINMVTASPEKADPLFLNAYANSFGEIHLNAMGSAKIGRSKKWSTLAAFHTVQPANRVDNNGDGFLDLPLLTRYMGYNKWRYRSETDKGLSMQFGLRFVYEQRIGGQNDYHPETDEGGMRVYGQNVRYVQPEITTKVNYRLNTNHIIQLALAGYGQDQESWFGVTEYKAQQKSFYLNLQHGWQWAEDFQLKWGLSYRYQDLDENIRFTDNSLNRTYAGDYRTPLRVPGVFAENSFSFFEDKVQLLAGARLDHHQKWGNYFTPRALLKWKIASGHTFRASAGRGWRQVNLFPEQVTILVSSRDIIIPESIRPEAAINWGFSHQWRFNVGANEGSLSGDFYQTRFENQVFTDYDVQPGKIVIREFDGTSRSMGIQIEGNFKLRKILEFKAAYNYLDVYRIENGERITLPFNPRNRAMGAVSARSNNNRWQGDVNVHWFDEMKLPNTSSNPEQYRRPDYSDPYATVNVQGTFRWKEFEFYAGCENIFGFVQQNPIIGADDPFGPYFDISSVWGPTRGREIYGGVRWKLKK